MQKTDAVQQRGQLQQDGQEGVDEENLVVGRGIAQRAQIQPYPRCLPVRLYRRDTGSPQRIGKGQLSAGSAKVHQIPAQDTAHRHMLSVDIGDGLHGTLAEQIPLKMAWYHQYGEDLAAADGVPALVR